MARRPDRRSGPRVLLTPAIIAVATGIGLAAGLLGEGGTADVVAWAGLLLAPALVLVGLTRR